MKNLDELRQILGEIFVQRTVVQWEDAFHQANALFGPVLTIPQVLAHPQMQALGMVQAVDHPTLGSIPQLAPPIMMSDTPGTIRKPPPMYGEHTVEILTDLGFSGTEIGHLADAKVVHVYER